MQTQEPNPRKYIIESPRTLRDYTGIVNKNKGIFIAITLAIFAAALAYSFYTPNKYKSTATLKVTEKQENILQQNSEYTSINGLDRYIANEIGIITNYNTRERVAQKLLDIVKKSGTANFSLLVEKNNANGLVFPKSQEEIAAVLKSSVVVEQEPNMDAIDITAQSPSPLEAAIIANTYAEEYQNINLDNNQGQLSDLEKFLKQQSAQKLAELDSAESALANFKEKGKVVALSAQSNALIEQLAQLESQRNATKLDLMSSNQALDLYKQSLSQQSPELTNYMENQTSQAYISAIQKQIADLQMNRDMALANTDPNIDVTAKVKEYNNQIKDLENKLQARINQIKTGAYASSPDQIKDQSDKLMNEEVRNRSLKIRLSELDALIGSYNAQLTNLPKESMQLTQYERNVQSLQQLYNQLQQKYQEVKINELSQTGNVYVLSKGQVPDKPDKPVRALIALIGLIGGTASALGFILIKNYFTEDEKYPKYPYIHEKEFNDLPLPENDPKLLNSSHKPLMLTLPQSGNNDAPKLKKGIPEIAPSKNTQERMVIVSSAMHGEGKTSMAVNIAIQSAAKKQNTLLVDCDFRMPMVHQVLNTFQSPGLSDYLYDKASIQDIVKAHQEGIYYVTAGTAVQEPAGLLSSERIAYFLNEVKNLFDFVVIVSAPVITEDTTEVLSRYADGIVLVVSPNKTDMRVMAKALNMVKAMHAPFLGTVYNNSYSRREISDGNNYSRQSQYPLKFNSGWR